MIYAHENSNLIFFQNIFRKITAQCVGGNPEKKFSGKSQDKRTSGNFRKITARKITAHPVYWMLITDMKLRLSSMFLGKTSCASDVVFSSLNRIRI